MKPKKAVIYLTLLTMLGTPKIYGNLNPFQPVISVQTNVSPRGVAVGDVFGNGIQSFVVANFGVGTFIGQNTPSNLLSSQNSNIEVFSPAPDGLRLEATIPTATSPRGVCLFDTKNSGRKDILVTAYDANLLQVFGWQNGRFIKLDEANTLTMPVGVAAGLNRPGGVEMIVVADYGANQISLFQMKDGKLGKRFDVKVDVGPTQVVIGDLNGNGSNEVAVVCLPANKIDILSEKPNSLGDDLSSYTVTQTLTLPDGSLPSDLRAADLNGDGRTDLVVADFEKNAISIFLQQKDGSLAIQPALSTSGSHPNGLTVADLNKDGGKEIIVANRDSDSIDIFQTIVGQYQLIQTLKLTNDSNSSFGPVEVGVLDSGNGKLNVVASHMRSNTIKVLTTDIPQAAPTPIISTNTDGETGTPFSSDTTYCYPNLSHDGKFKIHFTLDSSQPVQIRVFDVAGNQVWGESLTASQTQSGTNNIDWQGVNLNGQNLASGLYLCSIRVGNQVITKKVEIIR